VRRLLDSCVWFGALSSLEQLGHDVDSVKLWDSDPGDETILGEALASLRVLVTFDHDFGTLAAMQGRPHSGIIRIKG
jgi:predicted nuclease of predicted toxin-antitoxin system